MNGIMFMTREKIIKFEINNFIFFQLDTSLRAFLSTAHSLYNSLTKRDGYAKLCWPSNMIVEMLVNYM